MTARNIRSATTGLVVVMLSGLLAVVLACPLMMFFMMRAMGGMGHDTSDGDSRDRDSRGSAR